MNKDVFISYKAEEFDDANWVKSVLEKNGISCWMAPDSIPGGSSYAAEIAQAIRGCKVFVLILSEKAQLSKWVPKELDQAINENKTIMPFMVENCSLKDDFNFYLTNVQRYAAYESKANAIKKMIKEIKALLAAAEEIVLEEESQVVKEEQINTASAEGRTENSVQTESVQHKPVKAHKVKALKSKKEKSRKGLLKWFGIGAAALALVIVGFLVIKSMNTVIIGDEKYDISETSLYLVDLELSETDISNIAKFKELATLSIKNCSIDSADLGQLINPALRSLYLDNCGLTASQIASMDFTGTGITSLDLSGNQLESLELLAPISEYLDKLDISDTGLSDISLVESCPELSEFYANNNGITDISALSNCSDLYVLSLDGNKITDLSSLSSCTNLKYLHINGNNLQTLSGLEPCIELYVLQAGSNEITTLDGLTNATRLYFVFLNDNQIADISVLEKSANTLEHLFLNNNHITDISPLQSCIYLEYLSLDNNQIDSLAALSNCTLLEGLSAANNKLTSVKEIETLSQYQYLNLADNQLTVIGESQDFEFTKEYTVLDLSGNNISDLNIASEFKLRLLNLHGNPLTDYQVLYDNAFLHLFLDYADSIDFTALGAIECGDFKIIDCPLDRQVEVREILQNYRTEFVTSDDTGYDKCEYMSDYMKGVPAYYNE